MLIMCHPATEAYPDDAIAQQRVVEYHFFRSQEYVDMLSATNIKLARLSSIA
jgi:hypothetical protein